MQQEYSGLRALPVELLYEVQLYALSPSLPCLSHHFLDVFRGSPISFRVQYLLASCANTAAPSHTADILSKALRYPLCTPPTLDLLCSHLETLSQSASALIIPHTSSLTPHQARRCEIPRRLFRSLAPRKDERDWRATDEPLPFLKCIISKGQSLAKLDTNSHQGYALTKAVHARHMPLIHFLLDMGASPAHKAGMAVKVAIKQKNLKMVKMLIERDGRDGPPAPCSTPSPKGKGKRRRLEDRVEVDQSMLKLAVKCNARDIIDYFAWEKGVVPDMQTLRTLTSLR
ncbi:hypothetical protein P691DRAFT_681493 [Macrolepiota fuliginosa MF-IS2]|uniref:Ankyrin n=1 Tax=Macrolepiota fuliginosa MF-IS2 TaxID=1400762 RepID=A0A9P6BYF3_9AGAR|nr:hypothetical protein P691DRAFT_681493 [Macrolepiota fuliginosa MF-IS2]